MFSYLTLLDGITRRFLRQLRYLKALSRRTPRYTYRDVVVIAMATNNNNPEGVGASDREGNTTPNSQVLQIAQQLAQAGLTLGARHEEVSWEGVTEQDLQAREGRFARAVPVSKRPRPLALRGSVEPTVFDLHGLGSEVIPFMIAEDKRQLQRFEIQTLYCALSFMEDATMELRDTLTDFSRVLKGDDPLTKESLLNIYELMCRTYNSQRGIERIFEEREAVLEAMMISKRDGASDSEKLYAQYVLETDQLNNRGYRFKSERFNELKSRFYSDSAAAIQKAYAKKKSSEVYEKKAKSAGQEKATRSRE